MAFFIILHTNLSPSVLKKKQLEEEVAPFPEGLKWKLLIKIYWHARGEGKESLVAVPVQSALLLATLRLKRIDKIMILSAFLHHSASGTLSTDYINCCSRRIRLSFLLLLRSLKIQFL